MKRVRSISTLERVRASAAVQEKRYARLRRTISGGKQGNHSSDAVMRKHLLLATSSSSYPYIWSICQVPFLYQTSTILSGPQDPLSRRQGHYRTAIGRANSSSPSTSYNVPDHRSERVLPKLAHKASSSPIRRSSRPSDFQSPFRNIQTQDKLSFLQSPEKSRASTITKSEQLVFDRILQDLKTNPSKEPDEDKRLEDQSNDGYDPEEDLNMIFDTAIKELRNQEERVLQRGDRHDQPFSSKSQQRAVDVLGARNDEPPGAVTFWRPLKLANGIVLGDEMQTEEGIEKLQKACDDHRGLISGMLDEATTDVAIWQVLEKEVFKLVEDLNVQIKAREKALKEQDRKSEARKTGSADREEARESRRNSQARVKRASKDTIALPTDTLYSILSTNYSEYLLSALRLLRRHHPTSSYALSLLPTVKRLGPISYVLGASTSLYNEIMFLRWTQYSDLHGVADTLQEMLDQGTEANGVTNMLTERLRTNRRLGRRGRMGPVVARWWALRATDEGWRRILGLEHSIRKEESAAVTRRAGEMEEEMEEKKEREGGTESEEISEEYEGLAATMRIA